jgi:superfamily II DNA or RNA helicase
MKRLSNRELIQEEAVSFSDKYPYCIYEISTGVGKSLIAIRIIESYGGFWHIVIAETVHEQNWINEFQKHGKENLLNQVKFYCYQSLHKNLEGGNYICDEIHHLQSEIRIGHLRTIVGNGLNKFIGLSATLTINQKQKIRDVIGEFHTYRVTMNSAIELGILPQPVVYFCGVNLDNKLRIHRFNFNKDKYVICTEREYYDRISDRIDWYRNQYMESRSESIRLRWLKTAMDRKRFLSECKTVHANNLIQSLSGRRMICFTGSVDQSLSLSNGRSIHSKLGKKAVASLIDKFNSEEIDSLFCTGMLREGINLTNIEVGIVVQLDNSEKFFIQTLGRSLRAMFPEQYVMYVIDTQDEVYCNTVLENFDKQYVKFIKIEDI